MDWSKLSARERNQLKRKRKTEEKSSLAATPNAALSESKKMRVVDQQPSSSPATETKVKMQLDIPAALQNGGSVTPDLPPTPSSAPANYLAATSASNGVSSLGGKPRASIDSSAMAASAAANATSLIAPRNQWPFTLVCSLLLSDLFSPKWELRHGAALGLRELFKTQGWGGGRKLDSAYDGRLVKVKQEDGSDVQIDNDERHTRWCEDAAIRLLCVLSLDRLGDFIFDQVIAPVRETAGQTMASLLKWMPSASVLRVHKVLLDMVSQDFLLNAQPDTKTSLRRLDANRGVSGYAWEVRHAGLLGLKYEVTVRKDLLFQQNAASPLLESVVELAIVCLQDDDDDVRGVAAATLLPVVDHLVEHIPHVISTLMDQLWECLGNLKDDLSSSTAGVMDLLSKLVENPKVVSHLLGKESLSLSSLIPRLFPFIRHTITSVRLAVLNALRAFLSVSALPKSWVDDRLVRLLFQNLIVEERESIRVASRAAWQDSMAVLVGGNSQSSDHLVQITSPHLNGFFTILMTPLGSPIDFSLFYRATSAVTSRESHNVDKNMLAQDLALVGVDTVIRGRLGAAQALGSIMAQWPRNDDPAFGGLIQQHLSSSSALQKCLAAVVVQEWAEAASLIKRDIPSDGSLAKNVGAQLIHILESPAPATYAEMVVMLQRIQSQCQGLYNAFSREAKVAKNKVPNLPSAVDPLGQNKDAFSVEMAKGVVGRGYEAMMELVPARHRKAVLPALQDRQRKLIADIGFYQSIKEKQDNQVGATAAGAAIALRSMPVKLNPVIRSIMNSIKFEENYDLQLRSAGSVASFIELCTSSTTRVNPSDKIVKNLCAFVCQDTLQTAIFENLQSQSEGILTMNDVPAVAPAKGRARGSLAVTEGVVDANLTEEAREGKLIRRGAEMTLQAISDRFQERLFEVVPTLWTCMTGPLLDVLGADTTTLQAQHGQGQAIIDCCTLLEVNLKYLHAKLRLRAIDVVGPLTQAVKSHFAVIRSAAAKSLSAMADCMTEQVMIEIVKQVVPLLGDGSSVLHRQGSIETISLIVKALDIKLLPYVIVLIVPILGRLSDSDEAVRLSATNTFASLVRMVPLEAGLPDPPGFSQELLSRREEERTFLSQLLDGNKVEKYTIPVTINAQLRKYQQDGVNWMAFLAKFRLHGILCDDMGLGKTLQSICILAGKHHERQSRFKQTGSPDSQPLPSLIVCPPTLTAHWCHEVQQYSTNLRALLYSGQPQERARLQSQIDQYDCVVMSYDMIRNDIDVLGQRSWFYCILDEGHIIKSAKTKTTKAVKMIRATHRLILSGTPIQNNVLELWSLFDFLMPGFLGNEKSFMERYGRPILASRDAKVTAREHERASLALEALHKQVLPFLLRRMKEDVLDDLPPKIIQDISCDLGDLQKQLYDEFIREQDPDSLEQVLDSDQGMEKKQHVFQTLQYLRKLVCHPLLVFDASKPKHRAIQAALEKKGGDLQSIQNAPKLLALKQLLHDCGIGTSIEGSGEEPAVSPHRVLIFCQQRKMIDLIEKDLLQSVMPTVSYMRLDGSVSTDRRFAMVQRFNSDPSIDVLLLTTSVGGLGLTLTGADTVIFVEHDWNPTKDMQAMDRAHRLGQKKVVNVYRLITRNTLEEKIMGLQRFKLSVAGSVVNQENKGMESMETDQILDLFDVNGPNPGPRSGEQEEETQRKSKGVSQKAFLASIEAMQDTGDDYADLTEWKG